MKLKKYSDQTSEWPSNGRHILACHDDETLTVYQAFSPKIGHQALEAQHLDVDGFSLDRTSWIKPNFLWMMNRSNWGTKRNQEFVLGISIVRQFFDEILAMAVSSSFEAGHYDEEDEWRDALESTDVIFQWDPSRSPSGRKLKRKALQLGLRGHTLRRYVGRDTIRKVLDMSDQASEMHTMVQQGHSNSIRIPHETVYPITGQELIRRLGLKLIKKPTKES